MEFPRIRVYKSVPSKKNAHNVILSKHFKHLACCLLKGASPTIQGGRCVYYEQLSHRSGFKSILISPFNILYTSPHWN